MRRTLLLSLLLLPAMPATASACGTREGKTVASNGVVRVFHVTKLERLYRACLEPRGRAMDLGRGALTDGEPENFRLAGRFVAYSWTYHDRYYGDQELFVHRVDVRRRKTREWHFNWCACPPSPPEGVDLLGIRLMRSGAIAFMAGSLTNDHGSTYVTEVWVNRSRADSGTGLTDFRVAPGGVRWLHDGEERTAFLR